MKQRYYKWPIRNKDSIHGKKENFEGVLRWKYNEHGEIVGDKGIWEIVFYKNGRYASNSQLERVNEHKYKKVNYITDEYLSIKNSL